MTLEIEVTRQDYLDYNIYHFLKNRLLSTILSGLAGLLGLQLFIHDNKTTSDIKQVILTSALYFVFYFLWIYYSLRRTQKEPQNNGAMLGLKTLEFTDKGISYADKDSHGQYNWSAVKSINESKKAFYLYLDTHMAIFVPKRCFKDDLHKNDFVALVNRNIAVPEMSNENK